MFQTRSLRTILALGAMTALAGCSTPSLSSMTGLNEPPGQETAKTPATAPQTAAVTPQPEPNENVQPAPAPAPAPRQTAENSAWANVPQPVSSHMIRHVQAVLRHHGTYHGNIDGIWGPRSTEAMRDYQETHSLRRNGQIDLQTLAAMNLPRGNNQYGQANTGSNGTTNQGSNQQMGSNGSGQNGSPGGVNSGANAQMGNNGTQMGANQNYTTGPQGQPGSARATNRTQGQTSNGASGNGSAPTH